MDRYSKSRLRVLIGGKVQGWKFGPKKVQIYKEETLYRITKVHGIFGTVDVWTKVSFHAFLEDLDVQDSASFTDIAKFSGNKWVKG